MSSECHLTLHAVTDEHDAGFWLDCVMKPIRIQLHAAKIQDMGARYVVLSNIYIIWYNFAISHELECLFFVPYMIENVKIDFILRNIFCLINTVICYLLRFWMNEPFELVKWKTEWKIRLLKQWLATIYWQFYIWSFMSFFLFFFS